MATTAVDAQPDLILEMPEDSIAPLGLTVGAALFFAGLMLKLWWLVGLAAAVAALALLSGCGHVAPCVSARQPMTEALELAQTHPMPVGPAGRRGLGWWGVGTLIATEAALFAYLLFAYFYTGATAGAGWVLEPHPSLKVALPNTLLLIASSGAAWWGERGVLDRRRHQALGGFALAFVMGCVFAGVQTYEWHAKPFRLGLRVTGHCIS